MDTSMVLSAKALKIFTVLLLTAVSLNAYSQLTAPGRSWVGTTTYQASVVQDSIFVFYEPTGITLHATLPDTLLPATFAWERYNPNITPDTLDKRFESTGDIHSDATQSSITGITPGGYRVRITTANIPDTIPPNLLQTIPNATIDTVLVNDSIAQLTFILTVWVMVDDVEIDFVGFDNTCRELWLSVRLSPDRWNIFFEKFTYYDLSRPSHAEISRLGGSYDQGITWSASNSSIEVPEVSSLDITLSPPPLEDASYTITIETPFGRTLTQSTELIPAIATEADFNAYTFHRDNEWVLSAADDNVEGEALLELKLESTSLNADSIYWNIINDYFNISDGADSILWADGYLFSITRDAYPPKDLMRPGIYTVEHVSRKITNGIVCSDTLIRMVVVDSALINPESVPNVFTPGSGSDNSIFIFQDDIDENVKSIKDFKISIYSRWGKLVYHYSGPVKEWTGWDGTVMRSNRLAAEGVYYWIIEATGWDGKRFRRREYRGFVYLFKGSAF